MTHYQDVRRVREEQPRYFIGPRFEVVMNLLGRLICWLAAFWLAGVLIEAVTR